MTNDENLRIVVGTYAKLKRPASYVEGFPLYEWNCIAYYPARAFLDLSSYIERVEFTLHPSFENPIRKVVQPPFGISAEGWGEFPILVEVFLKNGSSVKINHYLKLNVPDKIVVNETFETISLPSETTFHLDLLSEVKDPGIFRAFSEYVSQGGLIDYTAVENAFISANLGILQRLQNSVEALSIKALEKEIEWLSVLNSLPLRKNS